MCFTALVRIEKLCTIVQGFGALWCTFARFKTIACFQEMVVHMTRPGAVRPGIGR